MSKKTAKKVSKKTKIIDDHSYSYSSSAQGAPIRFNWNGRNFLSIKEANKVVKSLTAAIKKAVANER